MKDPDDPAVSRVVGDTVEGSVMGAWNERGRTESSFSTAQEDSQAIKERRAREQRRSEARSVTDSPQGEHLMIIRHRPLPGFTALRRNRPLRGTHLSAGAEMVICAEQTGVVDDHKTGAPAR